MNIKSNVQAGFVLYLLLLS